VYQAEDCTTYLLESKQVSASGTIKLGQMADDTVQMPPEWVDKVPDAIDKSSAAYKAVKAASDNNTLVRGVLAVDKKTGKLMVLKLN